MIKRNLYIDKLKKFVGKPQVKIISGIRRSGKSTVLRLLMEELSQRGVKQSQIIYLNFESFANSSSKYSLFFLMSPSSSSTLLCMNLVVCFRMNDDVVWCEITITFCQSFCSSCCPLVVSSIHC